MDKMDTGNWCSYRLFREHCSFVNGVFVKDLSLCGRDLKDTIIVDNSPTSYMFQPECALPILSWYEDLKDRELYEMLPLLIEMSKIDDVRQAIPKFVRNNTIDYNIAHRIVKSLVKSVEESPLKSIDNKDDIIKPKTA
jgi:carboxy-terminal domain RNA polymerase II polypeptide A small phosphatase